MGTNPARVHRFNGNISLNETMVNSATEQELKYILGHEAGHFLLDTRSEFEADRFAFQQLAGDFPQSLKGSILSLSRHLPFDNPEHLQRLTVQFLRALRYDYQVNRNLAALETYNQIKSRLMSNESYTGASYYQEDDPFDNGSGKARREEKRRLRLEKKQLKNDRYATKTDKKAAKASRIEDMGEAKVTRAEAKQTKAENSTGEEKTWLDKTLGAATDIFGKKSASDGIETKADDSQSPEDKPKFLGMPKTVGIVVTIVLGLGIIGIVVYFIFRKK
jgi:hypothetical protein